MITAIAEGGVVRLRLYGPASVPLGEICRSPGQVVDLVRRLLDAAAEAGRQDETR